MDPEIRAALERELRELALDFAAKLPARMEDIRHTWLQTDRAGWTGASFDTLYRLCHSLAGAGGTFGFDDVGSAARTLTDWLKQVRDRPAERDGAAGADLLVRLEKTVAAATQRA